MVSGMANSIDLACVLRWLGCGWVEKDPKDSSELSRKGAAHVYQCPPWGKQV